jgi:hypothetical protein
MASASQSNNSRSRCRPSAFTPGVLPSAARSSTAHLLRRCRRDNAAKKLAASEKLIQCMVAFGRLQEKNTVGGLLRAPRRRHGARSSARAQGAALPPRLVTGADALFDRAWPPGLRHAHAPPESPARFLARPIRASATRASPRPHPAGISGAVPRSADQSPAPAPRTAGPQPRDVLRLALRPAPRRNHPRASFRPIRVARPAHRSHRRGPLRWRNGVPRRPRRPARRPLRRPDDPLERREG